MEILDLELEQLLLDPNNYRLQESDDYKPVENEDYADTDVQNETLKRLRKEKVSDLVRSIRANGFLPIERIVVTPYDDQSGDVDSLDSDASNDLKRYIVIEGNRRVAALMSIAAELKAGKKLPHNLEDTLSAIPCIIVDDNAVSAFTRTLMGVRHVSGIKGWGGYQQAKLIYDLRTQDKLAASEIADRLGMSVQEVNRRFRAFSALKQMQEDEVFGGHAGPSEYALFHEAVALPAIRDWLGWSDKTLTFDNDSTREQFYGLLSPVELENDESEAKITSYAQVRALREILPNDEARAALLNPDLGFLDASIIARRDELSQQWKNEVSQAATALSKLSAIEIKNMKPEELAQLDALAKVATDIIEIHQAISKK
jgi:hypothetical protein